MVKVKKLGLLVFCVLIVFASVFMFSGCDVEQIETTNYKLKDYNVVVNVGDAGEIEIHEEFTATYNVSFLHGVQRYIPLNVTAYYSKGDKVTKKKYKTDIVVLSATPCASHGRDGDYYYFNLGDASLFAHEGQSITYELDYKIILPDDRLSDKDVFYYNVLPADWDTTIDNASFTVNYSQSISAEKLRDMTAVYYGRAGSSDRLDTITFSDSCVSGTISHLNAFSGVTVYTEFGEGVLGTKTNKYWVLGGAILVVLILLTALFIWYYFKSRKLNPIVPTVEFKAPEGMTPAECGLILDGKIDNRDLVSMIVYWASLGYLKIIEKKKKVSLQKLAEIPQEAKAFEKTLFKSIFAYGDLVDIDKIKNFGEKLSYARAQLENDIKHSNYDSKSKHARNLFACFASITAPIVTGIIFYQILFNWGIIGCVIEAIVIFLATRLYNFACDKEYFYTKGKTLAMKISAYAIIVVLTIINMLVFELYVDRFFLTILSQVLTMGLIYMGGHVLSRTEVSARRLGQIIGLKNFILYAEKDKLEMLAKENPQSFYNILPYAYVLNVTDVYCEKFKDINLTRPSWYETDTLELGDNVITTLYFMNMFSRCLTHINTSILSENAKNTIDRVIDTVKSVSDGKGGSGGGLSGGGFSGGGFGGGGGRGW